MGNTCSVDNPTQKTKKYNAYFMVLLLDDGLLAPQQKREKYNKGQRQQELIFFKWGLLLYAHNFGESSLAAHAHMGHATVHVQIIRHPSLFLPSTWSMSSPNTSRTKIPREMLRFDQHPTTTMTHQETGYYPGVRKPLLSAVCRLTLSCTRCQPHQPTKKVTKSAR